MLHKEIGGHPAPENSQNRLPQRLVVDKQTIALKLDEQEYGQAWETMAGRCQDFNDMMLKRFDKDQNGELSEEELAPAKQEMKSRMGGRGGMGRSGRGGR